MDEGKVELGLNETVRAMAAESGVPIPPGGLPEPELGAPAGATAPAAAPPQLSARIAAANGGPRTIDAMLQRFHLERRSLSIPELDGLTFYFRTRTLGDDEVLRDRADLVMWYQRAVAMLIVKAEKEDGTPHFLAGDADALIRRIDSHVILRLINFMNGDDEPAIAAGEAAAAVAQDPSSASSSRSPASSA